MRNSEDEKRIREEKGGDGVEREKGEEGGEGEESGRREGGKGEVKREGRVHRGVGRGGREEEERRGN